MEALQISGPGITVATTASSQVVAIPNCANGTPPKYVRIASSSEAYVQIGTSATTATANSMLIQPADAAILVVSGNTHVAYIQGGASGSARLNLTPIDNQ